MIQLKITGVTEDKLTELERYELKEALGELGIFDVRTEETLKMDKNLTPPSPRDFDCVLHFSVRGAERHADGKGYCAGGKFRPAGRPVAPSPDYLCRHCSLRCRPARTAGGGDGGSGDSDQVCRLPGTAGKAGGGVQEGRVPAAADGHRLRRHRRSAAGGPAEAGRHPAHVHRPGGPHLRRQPGGYRGAADLAGAKRPPGVNWNLSRRQPFS